MMNIVISILTTNKICTTSLQKICDIFKEKSTYEFSVQEYKYDDRKYYEVDVDLLNVCISESNVLKELNDIISICEDIIAFVEPTAEFIIANDDTDADIIKYENDNTDVESFGLFVSSRYIDGVEPYYSSEHCNAYLNFDYVSFGVAF